MNIISILILCLSAYILGSSVKMYKFNRMSGIGRLKSLIHVEKVKKVGIDNNKINMNWIKSIDPGLIQSDKLEKEKKEEKEKIETQKKAIEEQKDAVELQREKHKQLADKFEIFEVGSNPENKAIDDVRIVINSLIIMDTHKHNINNVIVLGETLGELNNMRANSDVIATFESLIYKLENSTSILRKDNKLQIAEKFKEHIKFLQES